MKECALPIVQVAAIEAVDGPAWLVEGLWAEEGVGIVGGAPKCCKSWLALDLALSVASGTPALGSYPVPRAGPVLVFAAEDPPTTVRSRLEGLAVRRKLALERIPLHLILASSLRLDALGDQARLADAVARYRPRLQQCLELPRVCPPVPIRHIRGEAADEGPGSPFGTQGQVDAPRRSGQGHHHLRVAPTHEQ